MTARVLTLSAGKSNVMTTSVTTMYFSLKKMFTLKAIKGHFERSYDKQNITLVVISYEIYHITTRVGLFDKFHVKMRSRVISSMVTRALSLRREQLTS